MFGVATTSGPMICTQGEQTLRVVARPSEPPNPLNVDHGTKGFNAGEALRQRGRWLLWPDLVHEEVAYGDGR